MELTHAHVCVQQEEVKQRAEDLERRASRLRRSLEEGSVLMEEKELMIQMQADREEELLSSVLRSVSCHHSRFPVQFVSDGLLSRL